MNKKLLWGLVLGGLALAALAYYAGYQKLGAAILVLDPVVPP